MSGPNPPESGPGTPEPGDGRAPSADQPPRDGTGQPGPVGSDTDDVETHSRAYSAPPSEQFTSAPYMPVDLRLYEYENYDDADGTADEPGPPRWPWVVGVAVITAAIALVVSVGLLVGGTETHTVATPAAPSPSLPPVQDEITVTPEPVPETPQPPVETPEPPPPPPTETPEPPPPPPPPPETPEPTTTTSAEPTTTTSSTTARPLKITYSVEGTKAPFDQITITYIDAFGQRRTQRNSYIPWSMTITPISLSEVGSVEASSMLRLSKLSCKITSSDGTVLRASNGDSPQVTC